MMNSSWFLLDNFIFVFRIFFATCYVYNRDVLRGMLYSHLYYFQLQTDSNDLPPLNTPSSDFQFPFHHPTRISFTPISFLISFQFPYHFLLHRFSSTSHSLPTARESFTVPGWIKVGLVYPPQQVIVGENLHIFVPYFGLNHMIWKTLAYNRPARSSPDQKLPTEFSHLIP